MKRIRISQRFGLAVLGALLYAAAFPPLEWLPLAWFTPFCFLKAIEGTRPRERFRTLFCAGYLVAALSVFWFWSLFKFATFFLWAIFAFYVGLWGLLAGNGRERSLWLRVLRPAVAWCAVEYFRGELAPLCFSWLSLGYSQPNILGTALAPWIGVYGISFLMVLWAAGVREGSNWVRGVERARATKTALIVGGALIVPALALLPAPRCHGAALGTVGLQQFVEGDEPGVDGRGGGKNKSDGNSDTDADSGGIPGNGRAIDLVVWPEYSFAQDPCDRNGGWVLEAVRPVAVPTRWGMVFGAVDIPEGRTRQEVFCNTAWFLSPAGELLGSAVKNQPVQLIMDGLPADDVTIFAVEGVPSLNGTDSSLQLGVGICYDGSYQRFARRMASRDADALIFPTFNAAAWGPVQHRQHQRMFQMRAMETRLPVLTSAFNGPTFVASPNGRVAASLPFGERDLLRADIPSPAPGPTPFVAAGWGIGPVCLVLILVVPALAIRRLVSSLLDRFVSPHHP